MIKYQRNIYSFPNRIDSEPIDRKKKKGRIGQTERICGQKKIVKKQDFKKVQDQCSAKYLNIMWK
jgi:hypothetical protein